MDDKSIREVILEIDALMRLTWQSVGADEWSKQFAHLIVMQLITMTPEMRAKARDYIFLFFRDVKDEAFEDSQDVISFLTELVTEKKKKEIN